MFTKYIKHIFALVITVALLLETVIIIKNYSIITVMQKQIEDTNSKLNTIIDVNEVTIKQYEKTINDLEKLKKSMKRNEIYNVNGNALKNEVFSYINKRYQMVPKSLAVFIAEHVVEISQQEGIPLELTLGIIEVESSFNPMAISKKNARGLMQVMPEWAPKFDLKKVNDLHDIDTNISCGIKVLKIHIEESKGSISKGLYRYVGRDDTYAGKVFEAMGRFIAFRTTLTKEEVIASN